MPQYVPILKNKAAELWAWQSAGPATIAASRSIFEIMPRVGPVKDLCRFIDSIKDNWPQPAILTVDTGYLDETHVIADNVIQTTAQQLHNHRIATKFVMRLADAAGILQAVAAADALHGQGACLRLGSPDNDPDVNESANQWPALQQETGLGSNAVDLLIDFYVVDKQRDITRATVIATQVLHWAHQNGPWRSVTIASGAFPLSVSGYPTGQSTPIRRYDADLFTSISGTNPPMPLDFGDYGIWHPAMPAELPYRPLPNLRYTNSMNGRFTGNREDPQAVMTRSTQYARTS